MSDLVARIMPLAKSVSMFESALDTNLVSLNSVRPYSHELFRDRQLPPNAIRAARAASKANERSLTCVQVPAVLQLCPWVDVSSIVLWVTLALTNRLGKNMCSVAGIV